MASVKNESILHRWSPECQRRLRGIAGVTRRENGEETSWKYSGCLLLQGRVVFGSSGIDHKHRESRSRRASENRFQGDLQCFAEVLLRLRAEVISTVSFYQRRSFFPEEHEGSFKMRCFQVERDASDATSNVCGGSQPRPLPAWRCWQPGTDYQAEGTFRQCAKCGDIALMESRMSGQIVLDSRFVNLQNRRRDSLEVFRAAAVTKMRRAWQQWHRPETLRVSV